MGRLFSIAFQKALGVSLSYVGAPDLPSKLRSPLQFLSGTRVPATHVRGPDWDQGFWLLSLTSNHDTRACFVACSVNPLPATLACHINACSSPSCSTASSMLMRLGKQWKTFQVWGSCRSHGDTDTILGCWFCLGLALASASIQESESAAGRSFFVCYLVKRIFFFS